MGCCKSSDTQVMDELKSIRTTITSFETSTNKRLDTLEEANRTTNNRMETLEKGVEKRLNMLENNSRNKSLNYSDIIRASSSEFKMEQEVNLNPSDNQSVNNNDTSHGDSIPRPSQSNKSANNNTNIGEIDLDQILSDS